MQLSFCWNFLQKKKKFLLKFLFIYLLKITNKNQLFAQTNKLIQKPQKIISWDKNNQILRQNRENGNAQFWVKK